MLGCVELEEKEIGEEGTWAAYLVGILALPVVDVATVDHVASVDEELCSPHSFKEITRSS